jgi:hypothetical protein
MIGSYVMMTIAIITVAALVLNLPFGYLRGGTRKFSFMWFLYIHLPIPAIFLLRTSAGVGFKAVPVIVIGAIIGQVIGSRVYNFRAT